MNRGLVAAVAENEPVTATKLAPAGTGAGLPPTIPNGMRAISIRVNEVVGVAGFVQPGAHVDVVAVVRGDTNSTVSRSVLTNLTVLAAGTRADQVRANANGPQTPPPTTVVTLLVSPPDAERLALASSEGTVTLVLRNPLDTGEVATEGTRLTALTGGRMRPLHRSRPYAPSVSRRHAQVDRAGEADGAAAVHRRDDSRGEAVAGDAAVNRARSSRRATRGAMALALIAARPAGERGPGAADAARSAPFETVSLTAGRSVVLATEFDIIRVAVTNPAIADATVVTPREVLVDGKAPGTISLILWGTSVRKQYDVVVDPGVPTLQQQLSAFFPGEDIRVSLNEESLVLTGHVSNNAVMLKAGEIASGELVEAEGDQPAAVAGRQHEPAGDAAGPVRRSEPARAARNSA